MATTDPLEERPRPASVGAESKRESTTRASSARSRRDEGRPMSGRVARVCSAASHRSALSRRSTLVRGLSSDSVDVSSLLPCCTLNSSTSSFKSPVARPKKRSLSASDAPESGVAPRPETLEDIERLRHDFKLATSLINSKFVAEKERREKLESELLHYREQATMLAIRACETDSALERQSRAARSMRAKYNEVLSHLRTVTEDLEAMRVRDLAPPTSPPPPLPALDTSALPSEFFCPITCQMFEDPVVCTDGFTYEREAIRAWLLTNDVSPMTGARLVSRLLMPNVTLRTLVRDYRQHHGLPEDARPHAEAVAAQIEVVAAAASVQDELNALTAPAPAPAPSPTPQRVVSRTCLLL